MCTSQIFSQGHHVYGTYWDTMCILGHYMFTETLCVYWDTMCLLEHYVYTGTLCVYWDTLHILGHHLKRNIFDLIFN